MTPALHERPSASPILEVKPMHSTVQLRSITRGLHQTNAALRRMGSAVFRHCGTHCNPSQHLSASSYHEFGESSNNTAFRSAAAAAAASEGSSGSKSRILTSGADNHQARHQQQDPPTFRKETCQELSHESPPPRPLEVTDGRAKAELSAASREKETRGGALGAGRWAK